MHKDVNSWPQWLDLLVSVREYSDLDIVLTNISMRLQYNLETVVAISGQLLEHGIGPA